MSTDSSMAPKVLFHEHAERAAQRGRAPQYDGVFPRPSGFAGRYRADGLGLTIELEGVRIRSITERAPYGGLRQALLPEQWDGRQLVVFMGGAGAYAAAYPGFIAWLLTRSEGKSPIAVAWEDLPGYGYSAEGRRFGYVRHVDEIVQPQIDLLGAIPRLVRSRPRVILIGFSLGGQVALHTALRAPEEVAGVIAVAPLVRLGGVFGSWWFRRVLRLAASVPQIGDRYLYRSRLRGKGYLSLAASWYDEDYLRRKQDDAYLDDSALLGSLHVLAESGLDLLAHSPPSCPVRLLHSDADKTCSFNGSADIAALWGTKGGDIQIERLDRYPHQLLQLRAPDCFGVFRRIDAHLTSIMSS